MGQGIYTIDLSWHKRRWQQQSIRRDDHRSPFQRDRARILHSSAFRRLQSKTQVHAIGSEDFYRTRLTHSLEVSQIGTGILAQLARKYPDLSTLLDSDSLIDALGLGHDLGHPPFGHGGETALNYMMRHHGGFEGNGQTFRIVTQLEPYTQNHGMNLSRRTLLGLLKYPVAVADLGGVPQRADVHNFRHIKADDWHPLKAVFDLDADILDWVLQPLSPSDRVEFQSIHHPSDKGPRSRYKSLDCSIMELADDIAYAIHDLEDAIVMGAADPVSADEFKDWFADIMLPELDTQQQASLIKQLFSPIPFERKEAIGAWVNLLITAIAIREQPFDEPLLCFNAYLPKPYDRVLSTFKHFTFKHVIRQPALQAVEYRGQQIIMELFEAYASDPLRLLPVQQQTEFKKHKDENNQMRVIADFIACLTDDSAERHYQRLFSRGL